MAGPPRQAPNRRAVDAAEGSDRQSRRPCQSHPADRTQGIRIWMAQRGEGRGEEGKRGARPPRAHQIGKPMGGTRNEAVATLNTRPASRAQVHSSAERRGQPGITRHDENQTPRSADPRKVAPERCPTRLAIVAQHDAGESTGQTRDSRARIGQPPCIGEQPEGGDSRAWSATRTCPGEQTPIHRAPSEGVLTGRRS